MKKVKIYQDELHQTPYCWNGYIFDQLLKQYIKDNMFPNVATIGEMQNYIIDYIKKAKNESKNKERISRNTFRNWRTDGSNGPKSDYIKYLLDELFSNVYFLRKPCTKAKKEKLFEVYSLAWCFHYECALLTEAEDALYDFIEQVKQEDFHEAHYVGEILQEGKEYDELMKEYSEDIYLGKLLDLFWEGYHQILIEAELENTLYGTIEYGRVVKFEWDGEILTRLDESSFQEKYKDVLLKRQEYLEGFADNLRTLFLGDDL